VDRAKSKRLVIDADVLHSAGGEEAAHPTAKRCRDFLKAALTICHRVVRTPVIDEEWKRHSSNFSRKWRVSMNSKKKLEHAQTNSPDAQSLLRDIEGTVDSGGALDDVRKDMHLIHAALATDRSIVSCDETARQLFANASSTVPALSPIVWVNPDREEETPIPWLENGAEAEPDRMLCRRRKS
jgi:hypothetical protein